MNNKMSKKEEQIMTNTRTKEVYSEVNSFLNLLLEEDRIKITLKLRKLIND